MKKKIISLFTALVMAVGLVGVMPIAGVSAETSGDYEYKILDDGTIEITDYFGDAAELEIPDTIDEMKVTSIGDEAFFNCSNLTSVTIPNSVVSIGDGAFWYCKGLKDITISDSITSISNSAFSLCERLESVTIPDSVTSIGSGAFEECTSLTNITIPNGVTSIGDSAFSGCKILTSINVSENNGVYSSSDGILFNKDQTELICYPAGKQDTLYNIPNSVTSIDDFAFSGCERLTSITIPDSVTSIGYSAFFSCTSLTSVKIPDSVTSIGDIVFDYCESLTSVTIPNSVTSIGYSAFYRCTSLTSVTIPASVTEIGNYSFGYKQDYYTGGNLTIPDFKIYCYAGTAGEQYAIDNGFDYELLDDEYLVTLEEIDINSDGKISTADVGLINAHAKGTKLLSDEALEKADINKDGKVSTADVGIINAYAKGTKKYA